MARDEEVVWQRTGNLMWRKQGHGHHEPDFKAGLYNCVKVGERPKVLCYEEQSDHPLPQTRWVPVPVEG